MSTRVDGATVIVTVSASATMSAGTVRMSLTARQGPAPGIWQYNLNDGRTTAPDADASPARPATWTSCGTPQASAPRATSPAPSNAACSNSSPPGTRPDPSRPHGRRGRGDDDGLLTVRIAARPHGREPRHNHHITCAHRHAVHLIPDVTAGMHGDDRGTADRS